jgi:hypothetical protein
MGPQELLGLGILSLSGALNALPCLHAPLNKAEMDTQSLLKPRLAFRHAYSY